jgi:hypothetical protein
VVVEVELTVHLVVAVLVGFYQAALHLQLT